MAGSVISTSLRKLMVPIIKVVGDFCNLRCGYCFCNTRDQSIHHVMSDELLEKFLVQYMELFSGRLVFIWHGGEPLLAGLPFFQRAVDLQANYLRNGQVIQNTIQTNATLIDDEWASFFRAYNFKIGVSLDGDRKSHDHFRRTKGGRGSFDQAIKGTETLRRFEIEPGIIQTLTHDNVARAEENFDFFANILGAKRWSINPYLDLEERNEIMLTQAVTNEGLTKLLKAYTDLWLAQDDSNLRIREIENCISGVLGKRAPSCAFNGSCTGYFCLEHDGRIYPCDRLCDREDLLFGSLSQQSLLGALNSPARLKYAESVNSLHSDCVVCEWQKSCHNGCAHHRVGGVRGKYYYCEARKKLFAYLKEKVGGQKQSLITANPQGTERRI